MKHLLSVVALLAISAPAAAQEAGRAKLEAEFAELMTGSKMVGFFTLAGKKRPPEQETYTISKVEKVKRDRWRFHAKIEYGGRSVTVPLIVGVRWAGDTPMIQVTDMAIPMLGTYSARVTIYNNKYAGLWSGKGYGGHMYGRIVRAEPQGDSHGNGNADGGSDWMTWRGPKGTGVAPDAHPPLEWSEDKNIKWKVDTPGVGISSPIVWKDRIFLTTAIETGAGDPREEPEERGGMRGRRGGFGRGGRPQRKNSFVVLALDRETGKTVWQKKLNEAVPHEGSHPTGSLASNSPLTDGEHIYAHFGSRGLYCLDMKGNVKWSKNLGQMRIRNQFGEGSSPALYGDTLVVQWDHEGDSFLYAFDKRTGDERWHRERDEPTSWGTPLIVEVGGKPQVITTGTHLSAAYDLKTGKSVWSISGMTSNPIPSPIVQDGVAYLMSGFRGTSLQAIKLAGAQFELEESDWVLWQHGRNTSYVPSALVYDDYMYFLRSNNAVLSCLDVKTGKVHYEGQRISGLRTVYASPVGAAGRVYITSREGTTKVLKLGSQYEELATNELDDGFDASAAIVGDEIYLRGRQSMYCIAEK